MATFVGEGPMQPPTREHLRMVRRYVLGEEEMTYEIIMDKGGGVWIYRKNPDGEPEGTVQVLQGYDEGKGGQWVKVEGAKTTAPSMNIELPE